MTKICETALRDAHQSLFATRMRTPDIIEAAPLLDKVGYASLEAWGGPKISVIPGVPPTILMTNPGNYLITVDQTIGADNEVIVPMVISDLNTWLVIYTETEDGQPGDIIGQLWLASELPTTTKKMGKVQLSEPAA